MSDPEKIEPTIEQHVDREMAIQHCQQAITRCSFLYGYPGTDNDNITQTIDALRLAFERLRKMRLDGIGDAGQ